MERENDEQEIQKRSNDTEKRPLETNSKQPRKRRKPNDGKKICSNCDVHIESTTRCANFSECHHGYCDKCRGLELKLNPKCAGECGNLLCPDCFSKMKECDEECGRKLCLACAINGFFQCHGKDCEEEYCNDCLGEVCEICDALFCHDCSDEKNILEPCPDCHKTHCISCVCNAGSGSDSEYSPPD